MLIPWYVDLKLDGAEFSPDSKILATTDSLNSIELWDTSTGNLRALLQGHNSTIYTATFSPDGSLLATASRDGTARLWDVATGRLHAILPAGKEIARRVLFNRAGTLLGVGYHTHAKLWSVSTGRIQTTLAGHSDINTMVLFGTYMDGIEILFSPDGKLFLSIGDKSIQVCVARTGQCTKLNGARAPVSFSPDCKFLATTGAGKSIQLWSIQ
jgi:uncharacterized protein with WD repeat